MFNVIHSGLVVVLPVNKFI